MPHHIVTDWQFLPGVDNWLIFINLFGTKRKIPWLGDRDSNPDRQSQSLQSYR